MLERTTISCPYCGEPLTIELEPEAAGQRYIEDCQVCCRPMVIDLADEHGGRPMVTVSRDDE